MVATPLRRAFAAALLVLAVTALIIAIAQVSAQEDGGGGDDEERHSCWDHWLCDQHTAVPDATTTDDASNGNTVL